MKWRRRRRSSCRWRSSLRLIEFTNKKMVNPGTTSICRECGFTIRRVFRFILFIVRCLWDRCNNSVTRSNTKNGYQKQETSASLAAMLRQNWAMDQMSVDLKRQQHLTGKLMSLSSILQRLQQRNFGQVKWDNFQIMRLWWPNWLFLMKMATPMIME